MDRTAVERDLPFKLPQGVKDEMWALAGGDRVLYERLRLMVDETWSAARSEGYEEGRFSATYENRD